MTTFTITRPDGTERTAELIDKGDRVTVKWDGQERTTQIGGLDKLTVAEMLLAEMPDRP